MLMVDQDEVLVCLLGFGSPDPIVIERQLLSQCVVEKYKRKKKYCIGIAAYGPINQGKKFPLVGIEYFESVWKKEPVLENEILRLESGQ